MSEDLTIVLRDMRTPLAISAADEIERLTSELAAARKALEEIASNSTIPISIARNALRALSSKEPEGERCR